MKIVATGFRYVILVFIVVAMASLSADVPYGLPVFLAILTIGILLTLFNFSPRFPPRLSLIALPAYLVTLSLLYSRSYGLDESFPWGITFFVILLACGSAFVSLQLQSDKRRGAGDRDGHE